MEAAKPHEMQLSYHVTILHRRENLKSRITDQPKYPENVKNRSVPQVLQLCLEITNNH
jgi:hypothetical protein